MKPFTLNHVVVQQLVFKQPRSQGLRGETVTKILVKFILSFQNFGKKVACAVRHNRIAIQLNTVVSHCACDFFPKILERFCTPLNIYTFIFKA